MPNEIFLIPMVQVKLNPLGMPHMAPKYVWQYLQDNAATDSSIRYGLKRYTRMDEAVVGVTTPQAALDSFAAQPDVFRIASISTLDNTITGNQRNQIRAWLEAREIPGLWINTGDTRRKFIRGLIGMFLFAQKVEGRTGKGLKQTFQDAGVTLDTEWRNLPQSAKDVFLETATSLGFPAPNLPNTTPVRDIMKFFSEQWEGRIIRLNKIPI